jgi:hypothetical protein
MSLYASCALRCSYQYSTISAYTSPTRMPLSRSCGWSVGQLVGWLVGQPSVDAAGRLCWSIGGERSTAARATPWGDGECPAPTGTPGRCCVRPPHERSRGSTGVYRRGDGECPALTGTPGRCCVRPPHFTPKTQHRTRQHPPPSRARSGYPPKNPKTLQPVTPEALGSALPRAHRRVGRDRHQQLVAQQERLRGEGSGVDV